MAVRIQFRRGTAAEWVAANPTLAVGELGHETDTGQFKIGNGSADWANLVYSSVSESYVDNAIANIIDLAPATLDTLNELAAALGDDPDFFNTVANNLTAHISDTSVHGIENTLELATSTDVANILGQHSGSTVNVHGIANTAELVLNSQLADYTTTANLVNTYATIASLADYATTANAVLTTPSINDATINNVSVVGTVTLPDTTSIGNISATEISYLNNVSSSIQNQLNDKAPTDNAIFTGNISLPATTSIGDVSATEIGYLDNVSSNIQVQLDAKAPTANASFTGSIALPATTSIGDISSAEIGYLDNVSSNIQAQLDAKLSTSSAASIYAPLSDPTFVSTVTLPANTTIGLVTGTEIGYLDNVTSNIQTQLDAKAPTASPTFTGTVSGITATMVGLGSVDNTADLDKPISNATQSALDAKLSLSGGTMTGKITLDGDPSQALHAATKQYVDNLAAGLHIHEAAHAATTDTLANLIASTVTYDNGTDGVGATLSLGANLTTLDGHTLNNGDRILVKNQANAAHNGIYVRTSATLLTRADDFNSAAEIAGGDLVFVENGTLYNSTAWVVENEVNTVGTDNILWAQFSGAGTVTAGTNIQVDGLQVSVISNPTFANVVTASSGVAFSDGTQTKQGVPSITVISPKSGSYTLASLDERDTIIEISNTSATTLTIPLDSTLNFPVGTTLDIIQTNTGQVTIAGEGGVTVNATPGLKLRARWSSATLLKRAANTWLAYGDLSA
jgi:hypothetical protein